MAINRCRAAIDVVEAARIRVMNTFRNGVPVYMSFSGGKDSLVMADVVLKLIQQGKIDPSLLWVHFIDEEAIFDCIDETVRTWRKKFLMVGAHFEWFCLEVRHFNCFNQLTNDESFICWDSTKKDVWVRQPPSFAIRNHPLLKPRVDNYQAFLPRRCKDGVAMVGIRTAESIQRLQNVATMFTSGAKMSKKHQVFPIYDWTDSDVWLYLLREKIDIPVIYLYLWQSGTSKRALRVSQFFSIDTARSLVKMNEYYPDLMERIIEREPNAYLAALYWDSEMFGRNSRTRRELEGKQVDRDYKQELIDIFNHPDRYFETDHQKMVAERYRKLFMKVSLFADNKDYKQMYEGLMSGDPKLRTQRALYQNIYTKYIKTGLTEAKNGH